VIDVDVGLHTYHVSVFVDGVPNISRPPLAPQPTDAMVLAVGVKEKPIEVVTPVIVAVEVVPEAPPTPLVQVPAAIAAAVEDTVMFGTVPTQPDACVQTCELVSNK
jgi:hypothetical protein